MANCHLEINRADGIERRTVRPRDSVGLVDGECPGCSAKPFLVVGSGRHRVDRETLKSGGYCKSCGDAVGWIYLRVSTIFGLEEDLLMLEGSRCRVY